MDINIDDILADLDRDTTAVGSTPAPAGDDTTRLDDSAATAAADYSTLVTHWCNERVAPELLPYPHTLMARVLARLAAQIEHLETLSTGVLEQTLDRSAKLPLLCMEAELERLKFVVRSLLRCRLGKIDRFGLYLRQLDARSPGALQTLLSAQERVYYERHSAILLKLFNNAILRHMPAEMQAVDDTEGSVSMIDEPDWARFVFLYVREPAPDAPDPLLAVDDHGQPCYSVNIPELGEVVDLAVGGIYIMRYNVIKDLLMDGKVVLI
ncbi:FAFR332Wp [Eremothecium gossypii FDAG1]|nr:FAFR332Wp [Eremothecium gossypii FDAG1]